MAILHGSGANDAVAVAMSLQDPWTPLQRRVRQGLSEVVGVVGATFLGRTSGFLRIHRQDDEPTGFAGLWETWKHDGEIVESCAIVTTEANNIMSEVHNRMPVILGRLGPKNP